MSLQALQEQVRQLSVSDRLNLMNFILQSLTQDLNAQPNATQPSPNNRYPLRGLPIQIADDFDAPLPELWEALDE
jgi:hypothetical protein